MPVIAPHGLLTRLIEGDFPVHLVQEVIVDDDEDGADAEAQGRVALRVREPLVKWVTALVRLRDRAEDCEVADLKRLL